VVNRKYLEWGANPFCQAYSAPSVVILVQEWLCHNRRKHFSMPPGTTVIYVVKDW